jgi:hypothetical protein
MKLPKTIQLDVSDAQVFEHAATPGEWAVTGSFRFSDTEPEQLSRKQRFAFQSGWMGLESGGYSTFVQVTTATQDEFESVVAALADVFVTDFGAPDRAAALPMARDEVQYVADLCEFDDGTLLSLAREQGPDGVRERVRSVSRSSSSDQPFKIWELVED